MGQQQASKDAAHQVAVPPELEKFWRRLLALPRGTTHLIAVTVPEKRDKPPEWTVVGFGKTENKG